MKDVVLVCPQERDLQAIEAAALERRYRIHAVGPDLDSLHAWAPAAVVEAAARIGADGVVGTKDRAALLAALIAERLGLPGPAPGAVIACQIKHRSRAIQRRVAPQAVPRFARPQDGVPFPPPWFVKPVVGRLSQRARLVDDPGVLAELSDPDDYAEGYAAIAALAGVDSAEIRGWLVEEPLVGDEVTVEGFVHRGKVVVVGVTDSVKYPGTASFERFEYPSGLEPERVAELETLVSTVVPAHGFHDGFFNVEAFVPPAGPVRVVEVNARIASQFAPLVEAVHGRSTYDALLALACGDDPAWSPGPPAGVAASFCMRVFADAFVAGVPEPEPGLELLVAPGRLLSEQGTNDDRSFRLCIFSEAGETRADVRARCRARAARLRFDLRPVAGAGEGRRTRRPSEAGG